MYVAHMICNVMLLQEECYEIQQAVDDNNVGVLWKLIINGIDVNNAEVIDEEGVSDVMECDRPYMEVSLSFYLYWLAIANYYHTVPFHTRLHGCIDINCYVYTCASCAHMC